MQHGIGRLSARGPTIGFLITHPEWFHHFGPIIEELGRERVEIVLHGTEAEISASRAVAQSLGLRHSLADERIENLRRLRVLVSGHPFRLMQDWLPRQLADLNVRLMYALGKAEWNFSDWNEIYDLILCFGPWQAERLTKFAHPLVIQVGYPRYSRFFSSPPEPRALLGRLGCDPAKKTVLWLPTWRALSSIDRYADCVAALAGEYNVIVKPHPLAISTEPERTARLTSLPFTKVLIELEDNGELFCIADTVLCDYGGPAFGALCLDRHLLLLDVPGAEADALMGRDSAEMLLRQGITCLTEPDIATLRALLADKRLRAEQVTRRAALRERFFAPYRADSAALAAGAIRKILDMGAKPGRSFWKRDAFGRFVRRLKQWSSG